MAELGARIRQVLADKGLSQAELARLVGVKQQTISYLCSQDSPASTSRYAAKIAEVLGVNPIWLASGDGDRFGSTVRIEVDGVELKTSQVPLLAADKVVEYRSNKKKSNTRFIMLMTDSDVGDSGFAFEIFDDSMLPAFKPGDRVIFRGDMTPQPGDFVAAAVDSELLFRKFRVTTGGTQELVPMNSDWPGVSGGKVSILGVMVEHRQYRKRPHNSV